MPSGGLSSDWGNCGMNKVSKCRSDSDTEDCGALAPPHFRQNSTGPCNQTFFGALCTRMFTGRNLCRVLFPVSLCEAGLLTESRSAVTAAPASEGQRPVVCTMPSLRPGIKPAIPDGTIRPCRGILPVNSCGGITSPHTS